jgi:error-prone DNA polymerase
VRAATVRRLAEADVFASLGLGRQSALWAAHAIGDEHLPLFDGVDDEPSVATLPGLSEQGQVLRDYAAAGLSLKDHPVRFARESLARKGITPNAELKDISLQPAGRRIGVAGIVLIRQRPGTASGIVFITLEDETGIANLIVRPDIYEKYRAVAQHATILIAHGRVERAGDVVHVLVSRLESGASHLPEVHAKSRDFH